MVVRNALAAVFLKVGISKVSAGLAQVVITLMVVAWSVRLGSFLFIRVLNAGKDSRFDEIKDDPGMPLCMSSGSPV